MQYVHACGKTIGTIDKIVVVLYREWLLLSGVFVTGFENCSLAMVLHQRSRHRFLCNQSSS